MASIKAGDLFDTIVVGGHLTGLLAARALELAGQRVAIIEEADCLGGALRPSSVNGCSLATSLALLPASDDSVEALRWLEEIFQQPLLGDALEAAPLTFDEGSLKGFWGFGNRQFQSLNLLSRYNHSRWLSLLSPPDDWVRTLMEGFQGEVFTRNVVTNYAFAEAGLALTLNGARDLHARQVIYTLSPRSLLKDLSLELIPGRTRQRLAKTPLWTSVHLHLAHGNRLQESPALHFLYGSKDDIEPTLGRFFSQAPDSEGQLSLWMGLLPTELADDPEQIANTLREMKRQIRRAYPEALNDLKAEKIVIDFNSHGHLELALKDPGLLPELPSMYLAHPTLDGQIPLLAAINQARGALSWSGQATAHPTITPMEPQLL